MKNPYNIPDPDFHLEAEKYDKPIPSRTALMRFLEQQSKLMKLEKLAQAIGIQDEERFEALRYRLKAMVSAGQLIVNRRGGYGIRSKLALHRGRVEAHADGYGFFIAEGLNEDAFINPKQMKQLMDGDLIVADIQQSPSRRSRQEAFVVEIIERAHITIAGKFNQDSGVAFVQPDNSSLDDVLIPSGKTGSAQHNDYVTVRITKYPNTHKPAFGEVIAVLGQQLNHELSMQLTIVSENLPHEWPEAVEAVRGAIPQQVDSAKIGAFEDLRELPLVTIDGEDARDFDDAVYARPEGDGHRLWVAIADVSSYVKPGTALDTEAYNRGTSVYFPGKVIPMLPVELSNGICSLNPGVDRLCMVCEMRIDGDGEIADYRFYRGLMHSAARLTYKAVWSHLQGNDTLADRPQAVKQSLKDMHTLHQAMQRQKARRGAIEFHSEDVKIHINSEGLVDDIKPYTRNDAHKLIENFMIAANVCAARFLEKHHAAGAFRVHNSPPEGKLEDLKKFLQGLGIRPRFSDSPSPKDLARLVGDIQHRKEKDLIESVILRSQSLATYEAENKGHFGLALSHYAHFTSPIRRYPDLMVHRAIHHVLYHAEQRAPMTHNQAEEMCKRCSFTERRAEKAAREVDARMKCLFMQQFIGDEFHGTVSGVTRFGLFVQLDNYQVDGLVHVTSLPNDYYHFDGIKYQLTGERSGRTFQLTDRVIIRVMQVDVDERKIDFDFVGDA